MQLKGIERRYVQHLKDDVYVLFFKSNLITL